MTRAAALLLTLALAACAARAPPQGEGPEASVPRATPAPASRTPPDTPLMEGDRDLIAITALAQVGKPYLYGGNGPEAFDCSGLVRHAYLTAGLKVPRTVAQLFTRGESIDMDDARPGDLVFYRLDARREAPSHVIVYLGDLEGVHAPSSGGAIRAVRLGIPYFTQRLAGVRRLVR